MRDTWTLQFSLRTVSSSFKIKCRDLTRKLLLDLGLFSLHLPGVECHFCTCRSSLSTGTSPSYGFIDLFNSS